VTTIPIADVRIVGRHREDLGDLDSLAESLAELGQLQPIVVTSELRLIAGGRRLAAAQSLGWVEIEAKIAHDLTDATALLRAERDENTCRKAFAPTEEHALYEALLALERPTSGDERTAPPEQRTEVHGDTPQPGLSVRAKQSVAEIITGNAGRHKTLEKIGEVKRIAEDAARSDRLRQKAREALTEMDRTGIISGPHTKVMLAARAEEARNSSDMSFWSEDEKTLLKDLREGRTVVVSFREHHANLVSWAQAEGHLVSVDRRTEWGNPFEMPHDGDRQTVISNYAEHYLPHKPSLLARVSELRGKALACWCAPEPCHADVLKGKAEGWPTT
jgi:ParB family transcriptional regulator, chromosome partitioning protein